MKHRKNLQNSVVNTFCTGSIKMSTTISRPRLNLDVQYYMIDSLHKLRIQAGPSLVYARYLSHGPHILVCCDKLRNIFRFSVSHFQNFQGVSQYEFETF